MEELDLLKKDWNRSAERFPQVSETDIYAMLHRRSSSIVKWILIISILEFVLWMGLSFLLKDTRNAQMIDSYGVGYITIPMSILSYAIIIYFLVRFYINYKKITTTDNVKTLMATILKTRKTVSNYIFVNIAYIVICSIIAFIIIFNNDANLLNMLHKSEANGKEAMFYLVYIGLTVVFIAVFCLIIWLFYKLIYGILMKRLRRNYDELKKIDF
jgi:hypothetical protein